MRTLISIAIHVARLIHALLRLLPRRNKVVMLSRQANEPSKDFALLAEELQRRAPSLEVVVRCHFIHKSTLARFIYLSEVLVQMYHLATARVCIVDGYIVPLSILDHQDDLFVVQLWHALGGIKQFGYQSVGQPGGRSAAIARSMHMHRNYDVVLCGGPGSIAVFAEAFEMSAETVLPLGLPRVDYLRDACADPARPVVTPALSDLIGRYPRLRDRSGSVVLYAPTFRSHRGSAYPEVIAAFANSGLTLVVKPHDLESVDLAFDHVIDATGIDVLDLLPLCDAVVTDYSAVAFEAACIGKPVYYYVYDVEAYRRDRGLNIDPLLTMPSMSSVDIDELVIAVTERREDIEAVCAFREAYVPPQDVRCTTSIADLVFTHLPSSASSEESG